MVHQDEMPSGTLPEEIFDLECGKFQLNRISDGEYYEKWQCGLPIHEDYDMLMRLTFNGGLPLGRILVALESVFGKTGNPFDDWKGTFGFPFILKINDKFQYLFKVGDLKGAFFYTLYKLYDKPASHQKVYIHPIEDEFSKSQIRYFVSFFYGFLQGVSNVMVRNGAESRIEPFFYHVKCCNIIYGYWQDQFHQAHYESEEELDQYEKEISAIVQSEILSLSQKGSL